MTWDAKKNVHCESWYTQTTYTYQLVGPSSAHQQYGYGNGYEISGHWSQTESHKLGLKRIPVSPWKFMEKSTHGHFLGDMYITYNNGRCSIVLLDVVEVNQIYSGGFQ